MLSTIKFIEILKHITSTYLTYEEIYDNIKECKSICIPIKISRINLYINFTMNNTLVTNITQYLLHQFKQIKRSLNELHFSIYQCELNVSLRKILLALFAS
jgi:hypothetical protein